MQFLKHRDKIIDCVFVRIWYCVPKDSLRLKTYKRNVKLVRSFVDEKILTIREGMDEIDIDSFKTTGEDNMLVIVDDMGADAYSSDVVRDIFMRESHQRRISFLFTTQNFFAKSDVSVDIRRNASHYILFNSHSDRQLLQKLSLKFCNKADKLINVFSWLDRNIAPNTLKYVVIDNSSNTTLPHSLSIRTCIFPNASNNIEPIFFY